MSQTEQQAGGSLQGTAVNGMLWALVERFSVQGVMFVLDLVIARIIGPDSYGLIAMLAIFMAVSQVFIDGGFSNALIQCKERSERDYSTVFWVNVVISLVVYAALFVAAPYIAAFYNQPLLAPITRVYSLNLVLNSLVAVNRTRLMVAVDFKTQSKISFWSAALSGVAGVVMALMGMGVWALVWQAIVLAVLNVLLSVYYVRWLPRHGFSRESFSRLFGFGSKLLAAGLISALYSKLYDMVIGKRFAQGTLGLYSRADKFNQFASSNIGGVLSRVSFPVLSRIQDDDDRLRAAYRKYMQVSALVVFPLIMGLCGVARPLIELLLGSEWMGCVPLLQILSLAYVWDIVILVNLNLIYVKGRSDIVLRLEVIKKSIAIGILLLTLPFGLTVICAGRVVYSLIALYLNTVYTRRLLDYGFLRQMRELLPMILMTAVMTALALSMSMLIDNAALSLVASLVLCPLAYVAMCRLGKVEAYSELLTIIKEKLQHGDSGDKDS